MDENAESGANNQSRRMEVTNEREMTPKLRGKLGQTQRTEDMDSLRWRTDVSLVIKLVLQQSSIR